MRAVFQRAASFDRFAEALGVESSDVAAVIPRGGHDEPELWHVFFVTPQLEEGDALDVLLGPAGEDGKLTQISSWRLLPGFFDELYRTLDEIACGSPQTIDDPSDGQTTLFASGTRKRPGELVVVGIAVDRRVTVERYLCRYPCAERALAGMGTALGEKKP